MNICWENSTSFLLFNPCYSQEEQKRLLSLLPEANDHWPGHIWLSTSGSSAQKWVGLSKQALLSSATAINHHLQSDERDRWIHVLPDFHVGGLGIWARAHLSGADVYDFKTTLSPKWQAQDFYHYIHQVEGTLTALVPTQLHDLVNLGFQAPQCLRAVIIGGGALSDHLYEKAIALGWSLLPSYGLTECASQVATAPLDSWKKNEMPTLQLLSHIEADEREGSLCFSGSSLLSAYAHFQDEQIQFFDPKIDGWFISDDLGIIENESVKLIGRKDQRIKVGGENVDLGGLEMHLQTLRFQLAMTVDVTLIAMVDERLGHSIHLASNASGEELIHLIQQFQQSVLPFERIRKIHLLPELPRSPLGKILKKELMAIIAGIASKGTVI